MMGTLFAIAHIQVLPGGSFPLLQDFTRTNLGGGKSVFSIFAPRNFEIQPFREVIVNLGLRMLIDVPRSCFFGIPKRMREFGSLLEVSPHVAGQDVRFIYNLAVVVRNKSQHTQWVYTDDPILELTIYTRKTETPLRPASHIECGWNINGWGHTLPEPYVSGQMFLPFF